ncbi:MAG: lytic transglycosylase domain-containing protein [Nocardioides sp.]
MAVAATGVAVAGGVNSPELAPSSQLGASVTDPLTDAELEDRAAATVSRSDSRADKDETKEAALAQDQGGAVTRTEDLSESDPRDIAWALLPEFGFSADEFSCLDSLYVSESNWRIDADNPTSSAYGIPQALTSMHDLPADYHTSAEAQIRWGLGYIQDAYGTPCSAWSFKQSNGWY